MSPSFDQPPHSDGQEPDTSQRAQDPSASSAQDSKKNWQVRSIAPSKLRDYFAGNFSIANRDHSAHQSIEERLEETRSALSDSEIEDSQPSTIGNLTDPNSPWGALVDYAVQMGATLTEDRSFLKVPFDAHAYIHKHFARLGEEYHFTSRLSDGGAVVSSGYHVPSYLQNFLEELIVYSNQTSTVLQRSPLDQVLERLEEMEGKAHKPQSVNLNDIKGWMQAHDAELDETCHPSGQPMVLLRFRHIDALRQAKAKDGATDIQLEYFDSISDGWRSTSLMALTESHLLAMRNQDPHPKIGYLISESDLPHIKEFESHFAPPAKRALAFVKEARASRVVRYGAALLTIVGSIFALANSTSNSTLLRAFLGSSMRDVDDDNQRKLEKTDPLGEEEIHIR